MIRLPSKYQQSGNATLPAGRGRREQGFALTEVLVATAIAAGVVVVTLSGLVSLVRLERATEDRRMLLEEAQNIAARLQADLPAVEILTDELSHWQLELNPLHSDTSDRQHSVRPIRVQVSTRVPAEFQFSTTIMMDRGRVALLKQAGVLEARGSE